MNDNLKLQLIKHLGTDIVPAEYKGLFDAISRTYNKHNRDLVLLDKYVDMGSGKMIELNNQLKEETKRLKEAQNEVKTLFENTETVFFSVDLVKFKINQMSIACEKVYGYTQEEFFSDINLWQDVVHPDDKYMLLEHNENLAKGKPLYYQYRIIHKDGRIRWVDSKVIPTLNKDGQLTRIDGIVTDITEKKVAEQKLVETEHLLLEAQDMAKMGNWNFDMTTSELQISDTLRDILGISKEYIPNPSTFISQVHPEDKERVKGEIQRLLSKSGMLETTYRINAMNDGKERTIYSIMYSIVDSNGKVTRRYGMSQDITERKQAELEIEQLNLLINQISHDLRGPINSAKNYIYLALKRVNDRTAQNYLAKIQDAYALMEQRVLSLLDLQRMGRAEVHNDTIDLPVLVKDTISSIDAVKGFGQVKIITDIHVPREFQSDRAFLHSIFHNLVSNAINYRRVMDGSYVKIKAITGNKDIIINVSDNGQGIPEEVRSRLFQKFAKGEKNTNGTGLGLYIVKKLVSRLKGDISCTSVLGEGTTFTIRLPLNIPARVESTQPEEAISHTV